MKSSVLYLLVLVLFILVVYDPASGDVIDADDHPSIVHTEHRNAVLDTSTNRLWIDSTETVGLSFAQVSGMLGHGQEYAGWQLPELSDIEQLLLNAGIPYPTAAPGDGFGSLPGFNQEISEFLDIFGSPSATDLGDQAELWFALHDPVPVARIVLSDGEYGALESHRARVYISPPGIDNSNTSFPTVGTFLFISVPEPSVTVILASLLLVQNCRRRR